MEPKLITYLRTRITINNVPAWGTIPWLWVCWIMPYHGAYSWENNSLYLCTNDSNLKVWSWWYNMNLWHEIGHHINDEYMTEFEKTKYEDLWTKSVQAWKETFMREYWMWNKLEWFADDFMYVLDWSFNTYVKPKQRSIRARRILLVRRIIRRLEKLLKP
jgi:hypothetical protein